MNDVMRAEVSTFSQSQRGMTIEATKPSELGVLRFPPDNSDRLRDRVVVATIFRCTQKPGGKSDRAWALLTSFASAVMAQLPLGGDTAAAWAAGIRDNVRYIASTCPLGPG